ncbi:hypothetical protein MJD09_03110 [bacterium]|nr:hypothetical protein [bacterium]
MIFDVLRLMVVLLIAVPFLYMIYDVTVDVFKRFYGFYKTAVKPAPIRVEEPFDKRV